MTPFNSVEALCSFSAFRQGAGGPHDKGEALKQSVLDGEFAPSQLTAALVEAREEIYARCGGEENDEYETARAAQLRQAELYLATARLYERLAEKVALKFPEANLGAVSTGGGGVTWGADTPSPLEKMKGWTEQARAYRAIADSYLSGQGSAWSVVVGTEQPRPRYLCLSDDWSYHDRH